MIPHDMWLYHPVHGAKLFHEGEEHPGEGWLDHPTPHPLDHDGDGRLGGSLPKARRRKPA